MKQLHKLLLILIIPFLIGADSPDLISYPPQKILGFRGLDTRSTTPLIPDSRAEDLLNVKLSSALDLQKRYGYSVINNSLDDLDLDSNDITGIFDSVYSNTNSWTYAFIGNKVKYDNSGTWSTLGGGGSITEGQNNQWQCLMALDNAICTNDVDVPIQINSTPTKSNVTFSGLSDAFTKAKTSIWFRNFLVFGNTTEAGTDRPTRIRWSNVGTINTWSDDDFIDISTFGGDELVGFAELYGDLYIFLTKSIWRASLVGGDDIFVLKKVIDGIGAIARDSIVTMQLSDNRSSIVFLDDRKKVLLFNGSTVNDIGNVIQPTLDTLNESRLQYAVATFDGEDYLLSVSTSSLTTNDTLLDFQIEIGEWTKHSQVDANAFAQVKETDGSIKTYFGNHEGFVYWLDNPDNVNDVDGGTGIIDYVVTGDNSFITGGQIIVDDGITAGSYTGAIIRITSGTGSGQERVILSGLTTGVIVTQAFTTTPDSTSVYSIGDIDAYYYGKHYEMGDANQEKSFIGMLFWAEEESDGSVDFAHTIDFGSNVDTQTISLAPSGNSLWDVALWDVGTWGTVGDKIYTVKLKGFGNFIQPKFSNNDIDSTFHLYGFNLLATGGDRKQ